MLARYLQAAAATEANDQAKKIQLQGMGASKLTSAWENKIDEKTQEAVTPRIKPGSVVETKSPASSKVSSIWKEKFEAGQTGAQSAPQSGTQAGTQAPPLTLTHIIKPWPDDCPLSLVLGNLGLMLQSQGYIVKAIQEAVSSERRDLKADALARILRNSVVLQIHLDLLARKRIVIQGVNLLLR